MLDCIEMIELNKSKKKQAVTEGWLIGSFIDIPSVVGGHQHKQIPTVTSSSVLTDYVTVTGIQSNAR